MTSASAWTARRTKDCPDEGSFRRFVDDVKARTDLVALIGRDLDLEPSGSVLKARSPKHRDTDPSFVVWPATQTWHDFSGGGSGGGDCLDYLVQHQGLGFMEALRTLAAETGVPMPGWSPEQAEAEAKRVLERRRIEALLTEAAGYYHRVLPSKIRRELYGRHYGFSDETIDQLQLGWGGGDLFEHLTETCGASREEALSTGLFVLAGGEVRELFRWRLVLPYWRANRVVYFIARRTEYTPDDPWEQAKYKKLLTHGEKHRYVSPEVGNDYFFGEDAAREGGELLICEGITDAISAMQACVPCISPVTVRFRKQDHDKLVGLTSRASRVVICNDAEESGAGEAGALETARVLHRAGRDVRIASIPRPAGVAKIDVNELVRDQGPEALRSVMAQAKKLPAFLLDRILENTDPADLEKQLAPVLEAVVQCSPLERDAHLDAIAKRFDIRRRTLAELVSAASAKASTAAASTAGSTPTTTTSDRPQVVARGRQLRDIVADTWQAVLASNDPPRLFVRGGVLVRVKHDEAGARLETLDEAATYGLLARVGDWVQVTDEGAEVVFPPHDVARDLLAYPSQKLPRLEEVIAAPVFGKRGQVLERAGYHEGDRVWLELPDGLDLPPVPASPTEADVARARALFFDELLVDFPFVDASDKAHLLAALLLPFARRLVEGTTPIHLVEAPAAGTGKGLLVSVLFVLATGKSAEAGTLPREEDEVRKKLTSELLAGRPILALDNADPKHRVDSAALAAATTTEFWVDRLLGQTRSMTLANRAVWMLTGNNVRLSTELARRCVRIRIDAGTDRPWRRAAFKHPDLLRWLRSERGAVIHAALTLIQNWLASGRPPGKERLGSFESWAEVMGGILDAAGVKGFLGNLDSLHEAADEEGALWRDFVAVWWVTHQDRPVCVADLLSLCQSADLMVTVIGEGAEKSQVTKLGTALQSARDRVFGEHRVLTVRDPRMKRSHYRLEAVGRR